MGRFGDALRQAGGAALRKTLGPRPYAYLTGRPVPPSSRSAAGRQARADAEAEAAAAAGLTPAEAAAAAAARQAAKREKLNAAMALLGGGGSGGSGGGGPSASAVMSALGCAPSQPAMPPQPGGAGATASAAAGETHIHVHLHTGHHGSAAVRQDGGGRRVPSAVDVDVQADRILSALGGGGAGLVQRTAVLASGRGPLAADSSLPGRPPVCQQSLAPHHATTETPHISAVMIAAAATFASGSITDMVPTHDTMLSTPSTNRPDPCNRPEQRDRCRRHAAPLPLVVLADTRVQANARVMA